MGTFDFIGDILGETIMNFNTAGNYEPLVDPGGSKTRMENTANTAIRKIRMLEANLAKSLMICEALWEMLRDEHGWTEEDLHKKLYEVDMRDGVLDGKNQRKPSECPKCGRMVSARHPTCLYCGEVMDKSVFGMD